MCFHGCNGLLKNLLQLSSCEGPLAVLPKPVGQLILTNSRLITCYSKCQCMLWLQYPTVYRSYYSVQVQWRSQTFCHARALDGQATQPYCTHTHGDHYTHENTFQIKAFIIPWIHKASVASYISLAAFPRFIIINR